MNKIYIYVRNEQGFIVYKGEQDWGSRDQVIECYQLPEEAEHERLLGWPHSSVSWHGNLGFGEGADDE